MEHLTAALVIILLSTTASAKSIGRHQDADIIDHYLAGLDENNRWSPVESSSYRDSSSESSQSQDLSESSESSQSSQSSEESSEEILSTDQTTTVMTNATTTTTTVDGRTPTPEPVTVGTEEPTVTGKTPPPATPIIPVTTAPGNVTHCVTDEIPTAAPITENRGDN